MPKIEWDSHDQEIASQQGWLISEIDEIDHPTPFQLQAFNDSGVFENDDSAWHHVVTQARQGDGLALKALRFLQEMSPVEYAYIVKLISLKTAPYKELGSW